MARKRFVAGAVVLILVSLAIIVAAQNRPADVPPGVLPEMWIAINKDAGIAMSQQSVRFKPGGGSVPVYGTLMIRSNGFWQKVYLEPDPAARFLPAK